jgi:integrase
MSTPFLKVASVEMCQALMLAMHTGQRQGKGGGKVEVSIRCTKALKLMLDGMSRSKCAPLIVTTKTGRAFTKRYFAEQWQEAAEAAGIVDLHFHDLRGTAVTMLAEAGCTGPESRRSQATAKSTRRRSWTNNPGPGDWGSRVQISALRPTFVSISSTLTRRTPNAPLAN